jgi:hypothetical protein
VSQPAPYGLPDGIVGLTGAVERPEPGTLPVRADLAHIALAQRFLAVHYVIPQIRTIRETDTPLMLAPREDSQELVSLPAGSQVEALDCSGGWCWVCRGPDGPSGYIPMASLKPDSDHAT